MRKSIIFFLLLVGLLIILAPLFIVVLTSLTSDGLISLSFSKYSLANYKEVWEKGHFIFAFANSFLVAIASVFFQVITSTLAGYALARLKFRGKKLIILLIISTLIIPFQILVIPIFLILKWGHLINSYWALILPSAASGFGIFLMRQYFLSIPVELEEAATLDGANSLQIIWRILLPLAKPAIITLSLFTFIGEWNDLFKPLVFTNTPKLMTVQLALASFQEQFTSNWSLLMAAVVIASLPVIILFIIGQKQFIQGVADTGIKN